MNNDIVLRLTEEFFEDNKDLIKEAVYQSLSANEISHLEKYRYGFSDADGYRSGKSGITFGVSQFDMFTNTVAASKILKDCGFTDGEISAISRQTLPYSNLKDLESKLRTDKAKSVIDAADKEHQAASVKEMFNYLKNIGVRTIMLSGFVAAVDYDNQIGSNPRGSLIMFIKRSGLTVNNEMIRKFKLGIKWGLKRPDDVNRRAKNIEIEVSKVIDEFTKN